MSRTIVYFVLVLSFNCALSRNVPRFSELDEEDQQLFRAAYDTPSYDHDEYAEDNGNLDLMNDGLWAIKAKLKELKAFDKALAANMLSTKLKVKDLLENHMGEILNHRHKKKPAHDYQAPSYQPQYGHSQYGGDHQYGGEHQYGKDHQYGAGHQYDGAQQYGGAPQYGGGAPHYGHDPYYGH